MELDAKETIEEELVGIAGGCQVRAMAVEINHGVFHHGCSANDVMK